MTAFYGDLILFEHNDDKTELLEQAILNTIFKLS